MTTRLENILKLNQLGAVSIPSVNLPKGFTSELIEMLVSGVRGLQELQLESPDVETPGLLVKALISSYFINTEVNFSVFGNFRYKYNRLDQTPKWQSLPFCGFF
ncbi:MAG TPA: hypothetical protein VGZ71_03660 [Puia sp.]|jgi:hypothetical protein|nr:hypothetical protein [Puia sp.]